MDPLPNVERPTLTDSALDAQLRRDGYVVVDEPVLTEVAAAALRQAFLDLQPPDRRGFLNDFSERDRPYRRATTQLLRASLLPVVEPLFADHEPFLHTFLCKWPGDGSELAPHRDWWYVDERAGHRSHLAFVALEPIGGDNGPVVMLPGSQRLDAMVRGSGLESPWLAHREVIESRFKTITLRAGQCIVWDNATTHASRPNNSADLRVAAGLWMAPRGVPLTHYRRIDDARAARFDIDPDFYLTQNPFQLLVADPPYPIGEMVPVQSRALTEVGLARALDLAGPSGGRRFARWVDFRRSEVQRLGSRFRSVRTGS